MTEILARVMGATRLGGEPHPRQDWVICPSTGLGQKDFGSIVGNGPCCFCSAAGPFFLPWQVRGDRGNPRRPRLYLPLSARQQMPMQRAQWLAPQLPLPAMTKIPLSRPSTDPGVLGGANVHTSQTRDLCDMRQCPWEPTDAPLLVVQKDPPSWPDLARPGTSYYRPRRVLFRGGGYYGGPV